MLTRTVALFAFGVAAVLFGASQTDAQPGKGGKGPGGPDIQKLENDLNRLLEQVKETQAQLAKAKEAGKKAGFDKGGFGGFGGKGFGGKGGFGGGKGGFGGGKGGPGGFGPKAETKLDPATIKEKYELYKKLYDELPKAKGYEGKGKGKGKGKGFEAKKPEPTPPTPPTSGKKGTAGGASSTVEARIDRLIRELEELRTEVRGGSKDGKKKKG